ncbi:MAG TPA: hypothetical protein VKK79_03950, partial [Candidatus Lokiarchaeia archaeon]|nr:hypothetical protein [Candidatus Lokiarchaeia archaeon]
MNQKQVIIVFVAFFLHIFLIMYLPLVTTLADIEKFGDFGIINTMVENVQINPLLMYTTSFWFLPAWYYVFYFLTPLGIWGFLWIQSLFMCPTLYIFGTIVAKKTNNLLTFLVLMFAFALGWYYTFNYRAGNAKTIMLFFLV